MERRCESCKHWEGPDGYWPNWGDCQAPGEYGFSWDCDRWTDEAGCDDCEKCEWRPKSELRLVLHDYHSRPWATMATRADFGCVLWESKVEAPSA